MRKRDAAQVVLASMLLAWIIWSVGFSYTHQPVEPVGPIGPSSPIGTPIGAA